MSRTSRHAATLGRDGGGVFGEGEGGDFNAAPAGFLESAAGLGEVRTLEEFVADGEFEFVVGGHVVWGDGEAVLNNLFD